MSFIFPDPFLSEEQSFETMLLGLEYKNTKQDAAYLKPCSIVYDENSPFTSRCAMIKATETYSEKGKPGQQIESVPHWDSWIEELLNIDFSSHEITQDTESEEPHLPRTINQYSLSQILEMPAGNDSILGKSVCCSGSDIKIEPFAKASCNVKCTESGKSDRIDKSTEISEVLESSVGGNCEGFKVFQQHQKYIDFSDSVPALQSVPTPSKLSSADETNKETLGSPAKGTTEDKIQNPSPTRSNIEPKSRNDVKNCFPKKRRRMYQTRKPRLCQFLVDLLNNPERNPSMMEWIDETDGIFKFTNSAGVARIWGLRRHKPDMKFENFARSLRTYIAKGELRKFRSKLVYGFTRPENWFPRQQAARCKQ